MIKKNYRSYTLERIEKYNRMKMLTSGLMGDRNFKPQNSGSIMAVGDFQKPHFDSRGNCSFRLDSISIRGEENVLNLLSKIDEDDIQRFEFMEITEVKKEYFGGFKPSNWQWVRLSTKEDVINLLEENKYKLNWEEMRKERIENIINS